MASKGGGQTGTQKKLQRRQLSEIEKLESIEAQQKLAAQRRTRGRASLISGSEQGIVEDSQFQEKNLATKERLGVEAAEQAVVDAATAKAARKKTQRQIRSLF